MEKKEEVSFDIKASLPVKGKSLQDFVVIAKVSLFRYIMPILLFVNTMVRPESWSKEARRQYASIVFSTAVIHFPLGLAFIISGILLGYLSFYIDLTLGVALLLSGIVAIISTRKPCHVSINLSASLSVFSCLASISLFITILYLTFGGVSPPMRLVVANPLVWIYLIFSASALSLEVMQIYFEGKAVQQSSFRRSGGGGFTAGSIVTSSEHGGGKAITERTDCNPTQGQQWMPLNQEANEIQPTS